ncbi:MAG: response regulator, partial [Firmicutes bacterium]|nr:response regulator [Bacillota bacterium]
KCKGFKIVAAAENGADALEEINLLKPDIVITDIKMPVMDGIELVSRVKENFPFIYSVIVSGYQDFEYARGALQCGVVDYLLKPVNAGQLKDLLDTIRQKIESTRYLKQVEFLGQLINGAPAKQQQIEKHLPFKKYSAAILRGNGLPSRFSSNHSEHAEGIRVDFFSAPMSTENNSVWIVEGRDEMERIFIYTPEIISEETFKRIVINFSKEVNCNYHTTVFASNYFALSDIGENITSLYRLLENNIVIGISRTIHHHKQTASTADNRSIIDRTLSSRIEYLVDNGLINDLKKEFIELLERWQREEKPQIWVESILRQILHRIETSSPPPIVGEYNDMDFLLDEAVFH